MKNLEEVLGRQFIFLDGGTGSILQEKGLKPGELPERWNLEHPDVIQDLHYAYYSSGTNIVATNTFGAYEGKFSIEELKQIIPAAVKNASLARENRLNDEPDALCYVAYDMGPCGKLLKPMGDLDFEDAVKLFKTTALLALDQKIDAFLVETMNDAYEAKAAIIAVKEAMEEKNVRLPILATNVTSFNRNQMNPLDLIIRQTPYRSNINSILTDANLRDRINLQSHLLQQLDNDLLKAISLSNMIKIIFN